jgi:hypothetical protein
MLEKQCDRLTLAAMAMAEILRDKLKLTEHDIDAKLAEIDLRGGLPGWPVSSPGGGLPRLPSTKRGQPSPMPLLWSRSDFRFISVSVDG